METTQQADHPTSPSHLELHTESMNYLRETSKWSKFISIVGFVFVGLLVLGALILMVTFSTMDNEFLPIGMSGVGMGFIYLVMAAIYFFPILYLFRFSTSALSAVKNANSSELETALRNLKSHYTFIGILMIILIVIYALFFIAMIAGGIFGRMM